MERLIETNFKNRVAVIGSGMAGLSAAWFLSRSGFHVTVYEKGARPGLSSHSRDFADLFGSSNPIYGDVPSRMFNASLWPSLTNLYTEAGVQFQPVDSGQSFFGDEGLLLQIGLPYSAAVAKNILNPMARQMVSSLTWFQRVGETALDSGSATGISFGEFIDSLDHERIDQFLNHFLMPVLSTTVFTCPVSDLRRYPCHVVLDALRKISNTSNPLQRTSNGSENAANRLLKLVAETNFGASVQQITQSPESAFVHTDGEAIPFDQVVVATQANHASRLIAEQFPEQSALLGQFRYVDVPVVVHTDSEILNATRKQWSTFNFQTNETGHGSSCTVWMNRFHCTWPDRTNVFHSIFPGENINPDCILFSAAMQRPIVDDATDRLVDSVIDFNSQSRRVFFAGSYAERGVPLLESAVQSSKNVSGLIANTLANVSA